MINFKSKPAIAILNYFFNQPEEEEYVNQLAKTLNEDVGNLFRQLKILEKEGLLKSKLLGRQLYFSLNHKYPLIKEYRKIFLENYSWQKLLSSELKAIKNLKEAYIFGSTAKNRQDKDSDIDLLLVGDHDHFKAQKIIVKWQQKLKREINSIDFDKQDFEQKKISDPFLKKVFQEKIIKLL